MSRYQLLSLFLVLLPAGVLLTQSRSDYYDPYDYDLRNYQSKKTDDRYFKEYTLPPKFTKPSLVTPKNIKRPFNPLNLFPGVGNLGPGSNNNQIDKDAIQSNSVINPLTGELNVNVLNTDRRRNSAKDWQKKQLMQIPPYKETRGRRAEIIFLLTLPFGAALFSGITYLAGSVSNQDYIRTTPGALFMFAGGCGVAYWNVVRDRAHIPEEQFQKSMSYEKEHRFGVSLFTHRF